MITIHKLRGPHPALPHQDRRVFQFIGLRRFGSCYTFYLTYWPEERIFTATEHSITDSRHLYLAHLMPFCTINAKGKTLADILKAHLPPEEIASCVALSMEMNDA